MRYIIERGRETCLAPSASEIISHTQKTLTISLVRLCDISTNAEDACRLAHPRMRYIDKCGRRVSSRSSAYAIYRQTRKTRVVSLIRVCDILSNAEDARRLAHPRMRYIVKRGRRVSYSSSAYEIYSSAFEIISHTRKAPGMALSSA